MNEGRPATFFFLLKEAQGFSNVMETTSIWNVTCHTMMGTTLTEPLTPPQGLKGLTLNLTNRYITYNEMDPLLSLPLKLSYLWVKLTERFLMDSKQQTSFGPAA